PLQHRLLVRAKSQQILAISREAERKGCFTLDLSGYQCAGLAPSTERSIRIHFKLKETDKARILLSNILTKNDYSASEKMFASRFVKRNRNELSGGNGQEKMDAVFNTDTDKINPELCFSDLTLHDQPQKNIELAVMEKFGKDKYRCWHIENDGILSLFGLAMWSVIFHKLPGVFINANQTGPLDLFWQDFYPQRDEQIVSCLQTLKSSRSFSSNLLEIYDVKIGIANPFASWQHFSRDGFSF
ncbi:MAG: hypothetical protein KUG75_04255, partial [Pseudomonadales bacterium]|nr:hypothetical protein [Pseudomonadales bacterium]